MADEYSDLDDATLEAKLAEASSYDERAALRKALRARKKQRGDGAVAVRRGATGYNRFRTSNTAGKPQQQFIPAVATAGGGGGGGRKSPSVTPVRSTTPSSTTSPTPLSPPPQTTTSPLPLSPQPATPSPLPESEPIEEEKDEENVDEEKVDEQPEPPQEEEEKEEKVEEKNEEMSQPEPDDPSDEWQMVDKEKAKELEREARIQARIAARSQEQHDGGSPFKVQLRSRDAAKPATTSATKTEDKAEFQGYKLRKTPSQSKENNKPATTSSPRTLADYQRMTSKPKTTATTEKISNPKEHELLVNYVNSTLLLTISPDGSELYDTCCNPSTICKLINKSVRNTVDMRALTKTPPPSKVAAREEALQENMTLAVESARAIGCAINDETEEKLIGKDRETFRRLLFDLIRARLVHQPGMDNAPSSVFENLSVMMEKLGLQSGETTDSGDRNWRDADADELRREVEQNEETPAPSTSSSWKEEPSDPKPAVDLSKSSLDDNLSYEERAAIRKAERERRRKEREALASAK